MLQVLQMRLPAVNATRSLIGFQDLQSHLVAIHRHVVQISRWLVKSHLARILPLRAGCTEQREPTRTSDTFQSMKRSPHAIFSPFRPQGTLVIRRNHSLNAMPLTMVAMRWEKPSNDTTKQPMAQGHLTVRLGNLRSILKISSLTNEHVPRHCREGKQNLTEFERQPILFTPTSPSFLRASDNSVSPSRKTPSDVQAKHTLIRTELQHWPGQHAESRCLPWNTSPGLAPLWLALVCGRVCSPELLSLPPSTLKSPGTLCYTVTRSDVCLMISAEGCPPPPPCLDSQPENDVAGWRLLHTTQWHGALLIVWGRTWLQRFGCALVLVVSYLRLYTNQLQFWTKTYPVKELACGSSASSTMTVSWRMFAAQDLVMSNLSEQNNQSGPSSQTCVLLNTLCRTDNGFVMPTAFIVLYWKLQRSIKATHANYFKGAAHHLKIFQMCTHHLLTLSCSGAGVRVDDVSASVHWWSCFRRNVLLGAVCCVTFCWAKSCQEKQDHGSC